MNIDKTNDGSFDPVNYATLEGDVFAYIAAFLETTRDHFGETEAEATARIAGEMERFRRAPMAALLFYAEENTPAAQNKFAWGDTVAVEELPQASPSDDDDFNPEYREVEIDGEILILGNVDALIQDARSDARPEGRALTAAFDTALAELKEINGSASGSLAREEAWKLAVERLGIQMMMAEPGTQVPVQ